MTINQVSETLKAGDKTSQRVFNSLRSIGEQSKKLLLARDQASAAIAALLQEMAANPSKLDACLEKLNQARHQHSVVTKNLLDLWSAQADATIAPLADLANAALAVCPGFAALQEHWLEVPATVTAPVYEAALKGNLRLAAQ